MGTTHPGGKNMTVLAVTATVDIIAEDKGQWGAFGMPGTGFEGIFAVGDSFHEARRAFAEMAALALKSGAVTLDGGDPQNVSAIRVLAITRKTFTVEDLTEATS